MKKHDVCLAPSIFPADYTNIQEALTAVERSGARILHLDVLDGVFVPDMSFGSKMIADIRAKTSLHLDVHLMVQNPENSIDSYIDAGADTITFHQEATIHIHRLIQRVQNAGVGVGLSIIPSTPVESIVPILHELDVVLVMTVNPGFGGQTLIPFTVDKLRALSVLRAERSLPFRIACDGGVTLETAPMLVDAGTDTLVAGSAFFDADDRQAFVRAVESEREPA